MFYLVTYDIPDDRRRNRLAKVLLDFGDRVQFSVYECLLNGELLGKMIERVKGIVEEEDSVRVYQLCAKCEKIVKIIGRGMLTKDEEVYIV